MITKYEKANKGKLLVAVLALFVVLAGAAVVFSDSEVNAEDSTTVSTGEALAEALNNGSVTTINLGANIDLAAGTYTIGTKIINGNGEYTLNILGTTYFNGTSITFKDLSITTNITTPTVAIAAYAGATTSFVFDGVTFNMGAGTVYVDEGKSASFEGCTFSTGTGISYAQTNPNGPSPKLTFGTNTGEPNLNVQKDTEENVSIGDSTNNDADIKVSGTSFDKFTVYNETKVDVATELDVNEIDTAASVEGKTVNPVVSVSSDGSLTYESNNGASVENNGGTIEVAGSLGLKDTINADTTLTEYSYLAGNLTIPEGKILTITSTGTLDLMNFNLKIEGTLVIERNGVITSTDASSKNSISLMSTGSIQNSGIIGDKNEVKITNGTIASTGTEQSVTMQGVSGVSVGLERVSGTQTFNMVVSGDVSRISGASNYTLSLSNVTINDSMTIGKDVKFTVSDVKVAKNVTVENKGDMTISQNFILDNGAQFIVSSDVDGIITVETGKIGTNNSITDKVNTTFDLTKVKGITISTGRVTIDNGDGTSSVYQRAYITGTATYAGNDNGEGEIALGNTVYVVDTFVVKKNVAITGTYTLDVCQGGIVEAAVDTLTYCGAMYAVEGATASDDDTYYYTTFDGAMQAASSARDGEINVSGTFTVNQSYTLEANQSIVVDGTAAITIGESAIITVNEDAAIANNAISKILGKVIVNDGGVYNPASGKGIYEVVSTNTETNTRTYSGFKVALADAVSGDIIELVDNATYSGSMTVISGVTVDIADGKVLTVTGNVTVDDGGKIVLGNASGLAVGTDKKTSSVNVAGEINSVYGTISNVAGATINVYSTGAIVGAITTTENLKINSAYYVDGDTVYTSVAKAAAYAAENGLGDINAIGTFSESGDIVLSVDLKIQNGSKITLGNITLDGADITSVDASGSATQGTYSATVTAKTGEGDAAIDSTVSVTDSVATISGASTLTASGVNDYEMTISAISGDVTVSAGTVTLVGAGFTIDADNTLAVSSGATLVMATDGNIAINNTGAPAGTNYNDNLVNNGTIAIMADVVITSSMVLPGDITVSEGSLNVGTIATTTPVLTITGNLIISAEENKEGSMTVYGTLQVGGTPSMLVANGATGSVVGKVMLSGNANVIVFAGASVADADITDGSTTAPKSTEFSVNDIQFVAVYTYGGTNASVVNNYVDDLGNLDSDKRANIVWYSGETEVGKEPVIGTYDVLSTQIAWAGVDFKVSAGPGLEIYIDNVKNVTGVANLAIGEHTITVYVKSGYEGTPEITINGQAVTDGKINVTSEMLGGDNIIYATGATPIDYTQGGSTGGDSGMGLVEILLVILVVVVVILAIIVVLRMMRS